MSDCCKTKKREEEEYRMLTNRLSRIEGQVRGVRNMVENNAYCVDILTQVSAIQSALSSFSKELISSHIKSCVINDIRNDRLDTVDELVKTLERLMK